MSVQTVRLKQPRVIGQRVEFAWNAEPATPLYRKSTFALEFPQSVDPALVPSGLWWRIAFACLHPTWVLLRPCRVVVPVQLAPGEREFWLRLCDAATWSLEARVDGRDTARAIDLVMTGPSLAPLAPGADNGLTAACFSGGRDSLTQVGMLQELGELPLLVTTTAPVEGFTDHTSVRRRAVMDEVVRRRGVELVEVHSDLRVVVNSGLVEQRYAVASTELVDCLLYFGSALAVAAARGARRIVLASEAEVQETARHNGMIIQLQHFMYSAVTQRSLQALLEPTGIRYGSLTSHLRQFQIQRLLGDRYPDLRDLQYSCWLAAADEAACSACKECAGIAMNPMAADLSPGLAGVDATTLVRSADTWVPGRAPRSWSGSAPSRAVRAEMRAQMLRCLAAVTPDRIAPFVGDEAVARSYAEVREEALAAAGPLEPEPGYPAAFLALVDEPLRSGLSKMADPYFEPVRDGSDVSGLKRTLLLSDWISAPLRDPQLERPRQSAPVRLTSVRPRAALPMPLTDAELEPISDNVPAAEPALGAAPDGRVLRVADTHLEGNERRYLQECMDTNYISSTGVFVGRFEREFAAMAGSEHAVACSSGAAALQLAYAAAGIGRGDEVIMPAFTMVATANAASHLGAVPVFVDTAAATWNMDVDRVAEAIGPRTRAIVVVHTYGQPADPGPLRLLAQRNGLALIEDAPRPTARAHTASGWGASARRPRSPSTATRS